MSRFSAGYYCGVISGVGFAYLMTNEIWALVPVWLAIMLAVNVLLIMKVKA